MFALVTVVVPVPCAQGAAPHFALSQPMGQELPLTWAWRPMMKKWAALGASASPGAPICVCDFYILFWVKTKFRVPKA